MPYLVCSPGDTSDFFFADTDSVKAGNHWAKTIPKAIDELQHTNLDHRHSVFDWIETGCYTSNSFQLIATFDSSDLSQDFEAGIANFQHLHPKFFI